MAMTKRLWSLSALAVELEFDRRTVASALKGVAPDGEQGGHSAWFILTAIRALWPADGATGEIYHPVHERARKDRALARAAELKNAVTEGDFVSVDDVIEEVTRQYSVLRDQHLALPSRIASRLPSDVAQRVRSLIQEEVYTFLEEISEDRVVAKTRQAKKRKAQR